MTLTTGFTTYQFDVEVITPVHIGMAQEKHYLPGLDFLQEGRNLSFLNADALFKSLAQVPGHLDTATTDMANGDFDKLSRFLKGSQHIKGDVLIREEPIDTLGRDIQMIRRAYQTGLGQPALPGTSLKGAFRSVLLWHLTRPYPDPKQQPDDLFGEITANLMRYIQMSDVPFDPQNLRVYPMKVFSGDGNPQRSDSIGKWKHGRNDNSRLNHHADFMPSEISGNSREGFVNFYESLMPVQSKSQLRFSIGNNLRDEWLDFARKVPNYPNLVEKLTTGEKLIDLVRKHTTQYLEKERAYYGKFKNDDLGEIEARLLTLERHNTAENSCLLRVGANVGFHSITGDWQLESHDHFSKWAGTAIKNKTRKFAVKPVNSGYEFLTPGFIKLTLQPTESAKTVSRQRTEQRIADFGQALKDKEDEKQAVIQRQRDEKERKQLAASTPTLLGRTPREKRDDIEAVVIAASTPVKVQLYITDDYKPIKTIRYANDATVGTVVIVTANGVSKKGEIQEVTFKKIKGNS